MSFGPIRDCGKLLVWSAGAPAAVDGGVVVVPFSSGEVAALRVENGRQVWTESLTAIRRSDAVTAIAHIRGQPVI